jgi:hypothetical protein
MAIDPRNHGHRVPTFPVRQLAVLWKAIGSPFHGEIRMLSAPKSGMGLINSITYVCGKDCEDYKRSGGETTFRRPSFHH